MFQGTAKSPHSPHIEVFQRTDDLYDWHLIAANGEIMCGSTQGYSDRWAAKRGYDVAAMLLRSEPEVRYRSIRD